MTEWIVEYLDENSKNQIKSFPNLENATTFTQYLTNYHHPYTIYNPEEIDSSSEENVTSSSSEEESE